MDDDLPVMMPAVECPYCDYRSREGVLVCRGCGAYIRYGIGPREIGEAVLGGAMGGIAGMVLIVMALPRLDVGRSGAIAVMATLWLLSGTAIAAAILWRRRGTRFIRRRSP